MRDYSKLSPFFWAKGSGKRLRGDAAAQVVAVYLSTSPAANMVGIYFLAIATIANDTGLSVEQTRAALDRVAAARYAFYDAEAELVWIPNHARFEIGDHLAPRDKRRPKVLAELGQVDGHRFANEFRALYGSAFGLPEATAPLSVPPPPNPSPKPLPVGNTNAEGACTVGEQGRSDQDRSGQDRAEASQRMKPGTAFAVEAKAAFESAVADTTKRAFVLGSAPFHTRDICDAVNAHGPPGSNLEALAWMRTEVAAWAKTLDGKTAGLTPSKFLDWLNLGKPDAKSATFRRAAGIVQPSEGRAWNVPKEMP